MPVLVPRFCENVRSGWHGWARVSIASNYATQGQIRDELRRDPNSYLAGEAETARVA